MEKSIGRIIPWMIYKKEKSHIKCPWKLHTPIKRRKEKKKRIRGKIHHIHRTVKENNMNENRITEERREHTI